MQFAIDIALSLFYFCGFLLVCAWSWRFWMMYIHQKHLASLNWIMLEIKLPREIMKSPLATETALVAFLQTGGLGTWYDKFFRGNLPAYSSLEIASLEGVIHFYIRTQSKFKALVESSFYAQYPGIEIVEVEDYTSKIKYDHLSKEVSAWGADFLPLEKTWTPHDPEKGEPYKKKGDDYKMKADFYPIKTYVDYGLDKDPKEEFKTDPITTLLEFMGSIGKGEYVWYQILIQDESIYNKKLPKFYVNEVTHQHMSLVEMAEQEKKQIRSAGYLMPGGKVYDEYGAIKQREIGKGADGDKIMEDITYKFEKPKAIAKKEMELTFEEKNQLEAINKKLSKPLALAVIRLMYVAKKENFNKSGNQIMNILAHSKPYKGVNGLGLSPADKYQFPWQNPGGKRVAWRTEEKFEEYVEREGFFPHVTSRDSLELWEDNMFWGSSMKNRKIFRMIYEAIFYPFDHPHPSQVSTLNLEEIATLWHLPGQVAGTPTLPRIDSMKGVAPSNLPQ